MPDGISREEDRKRNEFIELLQAQAANLLTNDEARIRLRQIRPDWFVSR